MAKTYFRWCQLCQVTLVASEAERERRGVEKSTPPPPTTRLRHPNDTADWCSVRFSKTLSASPWQAVGLGILEDRFPRL